MQRRTLLLTPPLALLGAVQGWAADIDTEDRPSGPAGYPVSLEQMQQAVGERFPRRYPVQGLLDLELRTPRLKLLPQQNRMGVTMAVLAAGPALNRAHQGNFDVDFGLRYEASDRTLRAHQLRLARLDFPTLQPRVVDMLNAYAPLMADQTLREVVLHKFTAKDLASVDAMNMQPGAITVTDKGLVVGLVLK
ncbi:DUF1439 domain-containing protein [Hydrogenophaga laconesensis]|uniref:DUF1439 domain-containing protein n=1 Tax=Hydrogenophaga laconesensis TaxID=1805971 RepID=A0ABU1VE47_9BURK|nr:DUF1439 domain-containing protein [Hydrogenophaga laconesensis]MDR7095727.1 hypothetical protein [Hydrogenophaga laconesensis]